MLCYLSNISYFPSRKGKQNAKLQLINLQHFNIKHDTPPTKTDRHNRVLLNIKYLVYTGCIYLLFAIHQKDGFIFPEDRQSPRRNDMPTRKDVFNKLNETKKLPTPSSTTMEVIRLCQSDVTSLNDIAAVIQTDPALSAELLKYANAAFLATGLQVASIQKATVKLGMKTVVNVALGFSLLANNKQGKCNSFDYEKFWSASLLQAIAAKAIASLGEAFDPEELFICGLLADMGQLALASLFPKEYEDILKTIAEKADSSPEESTLLRKSMEKHAFHIDSSELTIELFLDWGLPAHYALAAGFYDDLGNNELGSGKTKQIAELLSTAQQISRICMESHPPPEQLKNIENAARMVGVDETLFWSLFDSIISQWYDWGQIFTIKTTQCSSTTLRGKSTS